MSVCANIHNIIVVERIKKIRSIRAVEQMLAKLRRIEIMPLLSRRLRSNNRNGVDLFTTTHLSSNLSPIFTPSSAAKLTFLI